MADFQRSKKHNHHHFDCRDLFRRLLVSGRSHLDVFTKHDLLINI